MRSSAGAQAWVPHKPQRMVWAVGGCSFTPWGPCAPARGLNTWLLSKKKIKNHWGPGRGIPGRAGRDGSCCSPNRGAGRRRFGSIARARPYPSPLSRLAAACPGLPRVAAFGAPSWSRALGLADRLLLTGAGSWQHQAFWGMLLCASTVWISPFLPT